MSDFFSRILGFFAIGAVAVGISMPAQAQLVIDFGTLQQATMNDAAAMAGLKWKVGDRATYKMSGGILNGTSENFVREETATGFWMQQDLNLGFMGKQKIEVLFNKMTGQVEKIIANGQEQALPDAKDIEVVEMKESKVRVAAGEFDCIYAKVKDKKNNQVQEAWLNPQAIPMSGMIKAVSDSQLGKITQELTSFKFGP
jgi:hypothetical protein